MLYPLSRFLSKRPWVSPGLATELPSPDGNDHRGSPVWWQQRPARTRGSPVQRQSSSVDIDVALDAKRQKPDACGEGRRKPRLWDNNNGEERERSFPPGLVPPRGSVLPGVSWGLLSMRIAACPLDPGASSDVSVAGWSIWIRGVPGCTGGCTVLTVATVLGCTTPQLGPSEKWQRSLAPSSQCCSLPVSKHGPRSLRSLLVGWLIQNLF